MLTELKKYLYLSQVTAHTCIPYMYSWIMMHVYNHFVMMSLASKR